MKDELRYEYFSVCKTLLTNQEVTKWQIFSPKHLQQVEPVLFTEVGCGGCNVASYVFKPSASTPPSHSPPDLFNEKAEKLVLQEIVFQFEFYKKNFAHNLLFETKHDSHFHRLNSKANFSACLHSSTGFLKRGLIALQVWKKDQIFNVSEELFPAWSNGVHTNMIDFPVNLWHKPNIIANSITGDERC